MVPSPFWKSSSSPVPYDERTTTYRFALVGSGNASNNHAKYCRSEEHTSELQSQSNLVCRLLLEKKKNSQRALRSRYPSRPRFGRSPPPACQPYRCREPTSPTSVHPPSRLHTPGDSLTPSCGRSS